MGIISVLHLMKQAKYIKSVMRKYRNVLTPGNYQLLDNYRSVSLKEPTVFDAAKGCLPVDSPSPWRLRMARILNRINYFSVKYAESSSLYDAIYTANNFEKEREVKLFSFKRKKILSVCTGQEEMHKQLKEYAQLGHAYKLPAVAKNSFFENALDVEMIVPCAFPGENRALTAIAEATMCYHTDVNKLSYQSVQDLLSFSYADERINDTLRTLVKKVTPELMTCKLPICLQHGDLSKVNLLYGISEKQEDFWFIDWEHKADRVFFYDYFFYILGSGLYGEKEPLSCYFSGENDAVLYDYFKHFRLEFHPAHRVDYFLIAAVCYLKERVCDLGNVSVLKVFSEEISNYYQIAQNGGSF